MQIEKRDCFAALAMTKSVAVPATAKQPPAQVRGLNDKDLVGQATPYNMWIPANGPSTWFDFAHHRSLPTSP